MARLMMCLMGHRYPVHYRSRAGERRDPNIEYRASSSYMERVLVVSVFDTDWEMVRESMEEGELVDINMQVQAHWLLELRSEN